VNGHFHAVALIVGRHVENRRGAVICTICVILQPLPPDFRRRPAGESPPVVDTVGFNARGWLTDGFPHTEKMHIVERYRRPDVAHLILDITIEDPGTFTKPWNLHMNWELAPGEELIEYICNENNQYRPK